MTEYIKPEQLTIFSAEEFERETGQRANKEDEKNRSIKAFPEFDPLDTREEGLQKITDFIKQGYMTPVAANAIPKIFNLFYPVAKPQDKEEKSIIVTFDGE